MRDARFNSIQAFTDNLRHLIDPNPGTRLTVEDLQALFDNNDINQIEVKAVMTQIMKKLKMCKLD